MMFLEQTATTDEQFFTTYTPFRVFFSLHLIQYKILGVFVAQTLSLGLSLSVTFVDFISNSKRETWFKENSCAH